MPNENSPLTEAMYYVLLALRAPGHGYAIMQSVTKISHGRVSIGPGTLYGLLSKMQRSGLIFLSSQEERRKTYELTPIGEQALRTEYSRLQAMVLDGMVLKPTRLST